MFVNERPTLGPMVSTACLQQLRIHTEDLAGRGPVLGAGRLRGRGVISDMGLDGSCLDDDKLLALFDDIFGLNGTRLCLVTEVTSDAEGAYTLKLIEGACTHGQHTSEPMCAYTLGVMAGALQAVTGIVMQATESECQAMGDPTCTYHIRPHRALGLQTR